MKILDVLKLGNKVSKPELVKKWQQYINWLTGISTSILWIVNFFYPGLVIPEPVLKGFLELLGGLMVIVNVFLTAASSDKINLLGKTNA